jgi:hypothetical protein
MRPTDPNHPWQRLVTLARKTERDTSAPFGFATRVTARALAQPRWQPSLFEIFALRALGIACLLMLASIHQPERRRGDDTLRGTAGGRRSF